MFTGLIEHMGVVVAKSAGESCHRLTIDAPSLVATGPRVGDSICVDGCCLTLALPPAGTTLAFDVVPQTLALTTLGGLSPGRRVHLEPSATLATLLGGHLVQGHVDGVGKVASVRTQGEWRVRIRPDERLMEFMAPQGSICVQGVSLTLAAVAPADESWFEVALIPTTIAKTTLGELREGDGVNIECDQIAKQVVHWLKRKGRES